MTGMTIGSKIKGGSLFAGQKASKAIFQSAWVVSDLDAAVRHWGSHGIGPFFVFRDVLLEMTHRGQPSTARLSFGLGQAGPMQIELVCQHDDAPSAYRDSFAAEQSGLHHLGRIVDDYEAEKAIYLSQGYEVAMEGENGGVRYGYIDTRVPLGCMTEIVQPTAANLEMYDQVRRASETWDGCDPFVELNLAEQLG
jgi:Glyoxalase/Bleomycin resistance protein/Dioxygenase superfamily